VPVSIAGGAATLALVWRHRFEPARATAALAVAAIIAGWGIAQSPTLLPGLSVEEAAAGRATLVALLVSIALGAVLLVPSLALLFGLVLRGRFDAAPGPARLAAVPPHRASGRGGRRVLAVVAVACLAAGGGLLVGFDSPGPNIAGALLLLGSVAAAFVVLAPSVLAGGGERDAVGGEKP
jgi:cytochrome d ubiquinol oxidase subunit II